MDEPAKDEQESEIRQGKHTSAGAAAQREEEVLAFWNEKKIFEKTLAKDAPKGDFIFYDGPPFATGLPHYGHILAGTIKDAIPRYKTMQGYRVPRRWGWDCHGLPLENQIEKELGLKSKRDIEVLGVGKFNEAARDAVLRYADDWKRIIPRFGRFVDMENDYRTMDATYTESVWWAFKSLHDKGLVYEGFKPMHLCPRCGTTLSNFEVAQGYKDITDLAVTIKLPLSDEPGTSLLAWTTTPWTLPGNMAAAVNADAAYVKIKIGDERYILAKERLGVIKELHMIEKEFLGSMLVGKSYEPPFSYFEHFKMEGKAKAWKVYAAPYVTMEDGTGLVHIAPAFGAEDLELAQKEGIPILHHVNKDGFFVEAVTDFQGMQAKPKDDPQSTDVAIIKYLAAKNLLFAKEKITHSYPHCWRCETPLLNYATSSWFVEVSKFRDKLVSENTKIAWVPKEVGDKRFGNWLENARDWAISRARYWGAPIPVWRNPKTKENIVIGSFEELKRYSVTHELPRNEKGEVDVHRPYIDELHLVQDGERLERVPDVFDCWFESGSMSYAQNHYPFEHTDVFEPKPGWFSKPRGYPADFIAEGLDQTRGWFYSLLVLGVALFGHAPYKNVIVNGTVLAEDGAKMSKRLKNYPDPVDVLERYGADAVRYYLLASPAMHAEDLNFSEKGVGEVASKLIGRLTNVLSFYELYQKASPAALRGASTNVLDRWIVARLNQAIADVTTGMESYELDRAARPLVSFVEDLSTWYVRRSRDRFKEEGEDAAVALETTRSVLETFSKIAAPFIPFTAEYVFQRVKGTSAPESVHLCAWPEGGSVDTALVAEMIEARQAASVALEARQKANIKVRQPLARVSITQNLSAALKAIVADEVNVKEVIAGAKEFLLDTEITEELKKEGELRDLVREVQDLRKQAGLQPKEKAILVVPASRLSLIDANWQELAAATNLSRKEAGDSLHVRAS